MHNRKRDTDIQNRLLDSVGEGKGGMFRENSIETCILSIVQRITSPGWMHETSARGWCTGTTQRDRVEREVGGGFKRKIKGKITKTQNFKKYKQNRKVLTKLIKKKRERIKINYHFLE